MTPFIDPLARDDIKPLRLEEYESIATAKTLRNLLTSEEHLIPILDSIESEGHLKSLLSLKGGLTTDPYTKDEKLLFRKFTDIIQATLNNPKENVNAD